MDNGENQDNQEIQANQDNPAREAARRELEERYPLWQLLTAPVALWGFLTVWAVVGWFFAGMILLLEIGRPEGISLGWVAVLVVCVVLNVYFAVLTVRALRAGAS